ncbi:MAG: hypothetical protein ACOZCL_01585 [Bacillota bacterium]
MSDKIIRKVKRFNDSPEINEIDNLTDMLESGMEDYEIAEELGISEIELKKLKLDIYND